MSGYNPRQLGPTNFTIRIAQYPKGLRSVCTFLSNKIVEELPDLSYRVGLNPQESDFNRFISQNRRLP